MDYSLIQHFGFAEMYEWKTPQNDRFGYLVELDTEIPNKIIKAKNPKNVIGVASISYATLSDKDLKTLKKLISEEQARRKQKK